MKSRNGIGIFGVFGNNLCLPSVSLGWKSREGVPKLVEDYLGGRLKVDEFVSHTFSLDQINEAFTVMIEGKRSARQIRAVALQLNKLMCVCLSTVSAQL